MVFADAEIAVVLISSAKAKSITIIAVNLLFIVFAPFLRIKKIFNGYICTCFAGLHLHFYGAKSLCAALKI